MGVSSAAATPHATAATAPQATAATAPHVRRNIWTLPSGDQTVEEYAQAVAIMQGRPAHDPTSWTYQAAMHGTRVGAVQPLWNGCQHGTWFFLAWHRMFIYYFEQIVRAAVVQAGGSADWSLPFWDYGAGGQQATLPSAFRQSTVSGSPNPLFESLRAPGINTGLAVSPAVASATRALRAPRFVGTADFGGGITGVAQFSNSTGQLEAQPHNVIHDAVGGNGGLMADPDAAAADPIFWIHHANIDRLWFIWNTPGHRDPNDPRWTGQTFSFFDANGQRVSKTPTDVVDIVGQLGYTYEVAAARPAGAGGPAFAPTPEDAVTGPEPPEGEPELVGASEMPVRLVGGPASVALQIDPQAHDAALAARSATAPQRILLSVEDIEAERNPGTVYGIYLNLPAGASADVAESHHAGNVSFFGVERARHPRGDEHAHSLRVVHDITELTRSLAAQGEWDGRHIEVTFRPLGLIPHDQPELAHALPDDATDTDPPVTIGRVAIFYE
ncbi:MAG: tyrosinase family protein [Solirubrobacteraceae bacterium]